MLSFALPRSRLLFLLFGGILLCTFLAFGRSLTQDFAPLDDDLLITRNLAIRGMSYENLRHVFTSYDPELYIPLTFVSYQINYMVAGLHPTLYHLTNILLHAGNALLVMWTLALLIRMYTGRDDDGPIAPAAIVAGFLFAVHPLNTEAVVWLAGRKDLLSTMFFLGAWVAYICYRKKNAGRSALIYTVSVIVFALALFSKVMAATLPAVLLLTDILIERRRWEWKMLIDKIPFAMLSGIFIVIGALGKERILAQNSLLETALMAAKSTVFYLQKFVVPYPLGVFYPYRGDIGLFLPAFLIPVVIVITLIALALFSLKKNRGVMFGATFFLVTLAPTFTNFHKGGEMYFASDRYPYLPQIGLLFLFAMLVDAARKRISLPATAVSLILIFCFLSFRQTMIWDSARSLFSHTLSLYPASVAARSALAAMDKDEGRYERSIKLLREGLGYGESVELRMGLGVVYAKMGRVQDARDQFEKAKVLDPQNPEPLVALGVLAEFEENLPAATELYRSAVSLDPSYVSARNKLGSLFYETGNMVGAEEQFRAALQWNPNAEGVLYNMSLILDGQGKEDEARKHLERANALSPDDPHIMTALAAHLLASDPARARELLLRVLRLDSANADAAELLRSME